MSDNLPALLGGMPVRPQGPPKWPLDDAAIRDVLQRVAEDGSWGRYHGPHCDALIDALVRMHQCRHALLTSSGTAAVELALRGVGVQAGDEVILAAYDFKANFTNVCLLGAVPVLVDVDEQSCQVDVEQLAGAVTQQTKAIVVSHLHGGVVDIRRVLEFAQENGVAVIEDACQLSGAMLFGRTAGMWGDVGVVSFGGSKLLSAGRGGAVVTNRDEIAQRIRLYTQRGNEAYPLSEIQAALLPPQLNQLAERRELRGRAVDSLRSQLGDRPVLRPFSPEPDCRPDYYKLGFWYDRQRMANVSRERFCEAMRSEGIPLDPGFRGLHLIHARRRFRAAGDLNVADFADAAVVVLHHPLLLEGERGICEILQALDKLGQHARLLEG